MQCNWAAGSGLFGGVKEADMRQRVGRRIRALRKNDGLTIEQLAEDADIDPTHLSGIERGKHNASLILLWKIGQALDTTVAALVDVERDVSERELRRRATRAIKELDADLVRVVLKVVDELRQV